MDSLTQACLGAAVAGVVMPRLGRRGLLLGAALGTLPDLDVVIDYGDAVADYTLHRSFSHSLFVLTGLATLLAGGTRLWGRTRALATFGHWWCLFTLCLVTHPLLDAFTTYGTQLLWPIPMRPISWSSLFIIDPLYTLTLLVGIVAFMIRPRYHRTLVACLGASCLYIAFSLWAQASVESRIARELAERGIEPVDVLVQSAPLTALLWRVTAVADGVALEGWASVFDGDAPIALTPWPLGERWRGAAQATANGRRLAWFAAPYLRYRVSDAGPNAERLEATDIRLGLPGTHPFVFALAERENGGEWRAIPSERDSEGRPDLDVLRRLFARIFDPDVVPVPPPPAPEIGGETATDALR
ncbi:metal-dependent hydrolase [Salinicola halophilus]|uniref:metal-dependent hydrolase n=1 Tax=Salinicola halophilus TaxID=184065 RepID=UPI000DA2535C|nr:metal-dependent hydrolase [Salinicola halophilus]